MRRFYLQRNEDASGVSGLGNVAEGCQHDTGWCSLVWLGLRDAGGDVMAYYKNITRIEEIHGHGGMTQVVWIDDESSNVVVHR
jgi:hypothetical protein